MSFKKFLAEHSVSGIAWTMGSAEFDKTVLKPFQKRVDQAMRKAKGKWDGHGYAFATPELQAEGQRIMDELKAEWAKLKNGDVGVADLNDVARFFTHQDKVDKTFKK